MSLYDTKGEKKIGKAARTPNGAITDVELVQTLKVYRHRVASSYIAITSDELDSRVPPGQLIASPKIDGELWYMIFDGKDVFLANPKASVIHGGLPLLEEAKKFVKKTKSRTIVAGELFALSKGDRPRVGDLAAALSTGDEKDLNRVGFKAFDVVWVEDLAEPFQKYDEKLTFLSNIFDGGKRCAVVKTETVKGKQGIQDLYAEWVSGGKAEGMVLRSGDGRIFKVKPVIHVDAAVIGYTERGNDPEQVRSLQLALLRDNGQFQLLCRCGNLGEEQQRKELRKKLAPLETTSSYRSASRDGSLYRFLKPEVVVEIRVTDMQSLNSNGDPIERMVLEYDEEKGWRAIRQLQGAGILYPVFERIRDDKSVTRQDVRIEQLLDRCYVADTNVKAEALKLEESKVLRRAVYTKETKGKLAVRKLLLWKTNKEETSDEYPAYVVHWTDYSPGRKDPLQRTVKLAPDEKAANVIAEELIAKNVKKGWKEVSD